MWLFIIASQEPFLLVNNNPLLGVGLYLVSSLGIRPTSASLQGQDQDTDQACGQLIISF